jgi:GNAT superfamily N-acetyltransferase
MSTTIRSASADDTETLVAWACAMAMETESKRLDPDTVRRGIAAVLEQPARGRYFIAEIAGKAAGTLMLTYEWSDWRCADWWWIQSVYVDPAFRRRGVFAALYRHVRDAAEASAAQVCGLRLYVERDNANAQRTYESLDMEQSHYRMYEYELPWLSQVIGATEPTE